MVINLGIDYANLCLIKLKLGVLKDGFILKDNQKLYCMLKNLKIQLSNALNGQKKKIKFLKKKLSNMEHKTG